MRNGAGKTTTMRMIVGLDAPTNGSATVNGRRYARHRAPLHEMRTLLEAKAIHPGRTAFSHLHGLALTHGIPRRRVEEVIEIAGLTQVARKRAGAFSLGMDPEGVLWIRTLLTGLAAEGRTVLVSSHLMGEMAQTATNLVIVGGGRFLADTIVERFLRDSRAGSVIVACGDLARLKGLLAGPDVTITAGAAPRNCGSPG